MLNEWGYVVLPMIIFLVSALFFGSGIFVSQGLIGSIISLSCVVLALNYSCISHFPPLFCLQDYFGCYILLRFFLAPVGSFLSFFFLLGCWGFNRGVYIVFLHEYSSKMFDSLVELFYFDTMELNTNFGLTAFIAW